MTVIGIRTGEGRQQITPKLFIRNVREREYETLANTLIWLSILSIIAAFFFWRETPVISVAGRVTEVTVPRASDGHYYVQGQINGAQVRFMIDTGASYISVSTAMATQLGLVPERSATFNTANGRVTGLLSSKQDVSVAGLRVPPMTVSIVPSLVGEALLGQNFLNHVTMIQSGQHLVLHGESRSRFVDRFDGRTKSALTAAFLLMLLARWVLKLGR